MTKLSTKLADSKKFGTQIDDVWNTSRQKNYLNFVFFFQAHSKVKVMIKTPIVENPRRSEEIVNFVDGVFKKMWFF